MASVTYWTRLEPYTRSANIDSGLQATLHDPLWMIGRQWQVGEFRAEDAGTPIQAQLRGSQAPLARFRAGPLNGNAVGSQPYDHDLPLEALVERAPLRQSFHPGRVAEAGLHFLRLLKVHGVGQYRGAYLTVYPLPNQDEYYRDSASRRYLQVVQGRALNAQRLFQDLAPTQAGGTPDLPVDPAIAAADRAAVLQAMTEWLNWYEQRFSEPEPNADPWQPRRMEHAFAVSAAAPEANAETVLVAPEYPGGRLDWYSFDQNSEVRLGISSQDNQGQPLVRTVIPTPVSFRGMPNARWWSFEDTVFNLNDLGNELSRQENGYSDLGRTLLLQFALTYSDDWFVIPIDLDVGSVLYVDSLVVTDTFGVRSRIKSSAQVDRDNDRASSWQMFTHIQQDGERPRGDRLFMPPVQATNLNSQPVEEVLLLRDEMANLVWAVERQIENARGQASRRHETELIELNNRPAPSSSMPEDAELVYQLMNNAPPHWIPLVPRVAEVPRRLQFQKGQMLKYRNASRVELPTYGQLLNAEDPLILEAEEVPRSGIALTRAYQHTRWIDGTSHVWMTRRKRPGRGEGWSGLRYDVAEPLINREEV